MLCKDESPLKNIVMAVAVRLFKAAREKLEEQISRDTTDDTIT